MRTARRGGPFRQFDSGLDQETVKSLMPLASRQTTFWPLSLSVRLRRSELAETVMQRLRAGQSLMA